MLLSFLQGPRVLAPPTVLLRRSMNLVRGCLEPLLHGRGGIRGPYGGLGLPFSAPPSSRARVCLARSEERRVGKEGRSRWSPFHLKKKIKGWAAMRWTTVAGIIVES